MTTRCIADTSVFIANESGRPIDPKLLPEEVGISIITAAELRVGVLAATDPSIRARRLETLARALHLDPLPIDAAVAAAWAELRIALRDVGRSMPLNDSWIAATALAHDAAVLTQDDDFAGVPGLAVIRV